MKGRDLIRYYFVRVASRIFGKRIAITRLRAAQVFEIMGRDRFLMRNGFSEKKA